jgi:hypothetical protein
MEILPEAFAVMKDTARRFTENKTIDVIATPTVNWQPEKRMSLFRGIKLYTIIHGLPPGLK